jgi:uncharacterized protein YjbJ (UPF0337 family)
MIATERLICTHTARSHAADSTDRRSDMNSDQIKGKAKDIGGKIQEEVGKAVGSSEQQAKGLANQVEGKVQEKYGDAKDVLNTNSSDSIDRGNR